MARSRPGGWPSSSGRRAVRVADAGRDADLVVIATPDAAIAECAAALAVGVPAGALVIHLSGACTLDELAKLRVTRPDVHIGSLHPLQSLPSVELGVARLAGSWCAVDGPAAVERLAVSLGMRPFRVSDSDRVAYHAAATIASEPSRRAAGSGDACRRRRGRSRRRALAIGARHHRQCHRAGPGRRAHRTGARGDVDTVARHLDSLPADERDAYRALAEQALRLCGRDDPALSLLLSGVSGSDVL